MKSNKLKTATVILALTIGALTFGALGLKEEPEPSKLEVTKREEVNPIIVKPEPVKPVQPAKPEKAVEVVASIDPVEQNLYEHMVEQDVPESTARKYAKLILKYAEKYGVDPYTILAMIQLESHFDSSVVGKADDVGLLQIRPTAQKATGIKGDRRDPEVNIEIGVKYLAYNQKRFGRDLGIVAYNQGEGNVARGTYNTKYLTRVENILVTIDR